MKNKILLLLLLSLSLILGKAQIDQNVTKYKSTWTSLRQHQTPNWLRDAKFGIYCHWGVWTIQYAEGYKEGGDKLGLDDAISKFKAEKFDPATWAKLFKTAGARFGGPVGWHGTKYLHWDSKLTEYNSVKMSPHIDIVGELEREIKKQGLKFFVSYHYGIGMVKDGWINFAKEGVDNYSPDIFWVDAGFGGTKAANHNNILKNSKYIGKSTNYPTSLGDKLQREFISYYYNHAEKNNKEVEFIYKSFDIPPGVGMRDLENGLLDNIAYDTWITDIDMNICPDWETHGWFYREGIPLRSTNNLVDILVDIVSKNGILLLNVPPLADGSFNEEVQHNLSELGKWLDINGEAIYGASPWFIYGEGPTEVKSNNYSFHHNDHFGTHHFTKEDIRFTVNGEYLYITCLGEPERRLTVKALNTKYKVKEGDIVSVSLVGSGEKLKWTHNEEALSIEMPDQKLNEYANVFKVLLR